MSKSFHLQGVFRIASQPTTKTGQSEVALVDRTGDDVPPLPTEVIPAGASEACPEHRLKVTKYAQNL